MSDTSYLRLPRWPLLALAGFLFTACNFFNPGGTGSYPSDDPDAFIDLGQRALQARDFNSAWTNFTKALALDSSKSLAYQGLAKAEMGRDSFSLATLVWLADTLSKTNDDSARIGFLTNLGIDTLNHLYHPLMRTAEIYRKLQARDTSGGTDGVFQFHLVQFELDAIASSQTYFRIIDANGNWYIEPNEIRTLRLLTKLSSSRGSSLNADTLKNLCKIATDGSVDTEAVNNINGILTNFATLTGTAKTAIAGGDSNSTTSQVTQDAMAFLDGLMTSTSFYLINDSLDNDGDGCINEEITGDSLDNDGDSLKEEDGRLGYQASNTPVVGQPAMVSPSALSLRYAFDGIKSRLDVVGRNPDDLRWSDAQGLLAPYQGMRWVRWDEYSTSRNDTVFARVVRAETQGAYTVETVKNSPDYKDIRTKAIIEIRKKVLAESDPTRRVNIGKKTVGGCWDAL